MPKKVLLIEDSPLVRKVYHENLTGMGYEVHEAADGEEGFNKAVEVKPDIILLDIIMPRMGGLGTLERLKDDYNTLHIPVIILTGAEREDEKEQALEMGAVDYISKQNTSPQEMADRISKILSP